MPSANILVVEDESLIAAEIAAHLSRLGYRINGIADNAAAALREVASARPHLALVDIRIKGPVNGIQLARQFRDDFHIPVVFLTAHADPETLRAAGGAEPFGYIIKPFDPPSLAATVEMALYRDRAEARIAGMERWLTTTLNSIGDAVIATDAQGRINFINPRAQTLTGWRAADAVGKPLVEVLRLRSEIGNDTLATSLTRITAEGCQRIDQESFLITQRGERVAVDESVAPIRDENGAMTGVVILLHDRTERLAIEHRVRNLNAELEERVRLRTTELRAANTELEMFAHSVSHDLRAPLRAINGYAQLLAKNHVKAIEPEGAHFLRRLIDNSARMSSMIDDYLRLARASRSELRCETIDMAQLLRAAWQEVTGDMPQPPEFIVGPLAPVQADASLLRILIANLLSNAVKFSRNVPTPEVHVVCTVTGDRNWYAISDNGVGFDPRFTSKLFRVFERLHEAREYEGNGIGLSIVQRIAQRHGGDASIRAEPGRGATATFWLPHTPPLVESPLTR